MLGIKDTITGVLILTLILTLICGFFYVDFLNSSHEKETLGLRNLVASKDSVIQDKNGVYSRLSMEYNSQKDLNNILKKQNASLANEIKEKNEKIAYLMTVVVKPDTVQIITNTVVKDSIASFSGYKKPFGVMGKYHLKDSTTTDLNVKMDDFKLNIVESKLENGFFRARIRLTDLQNNTLEMFKIQSIESAVNSDPNSKEESYFGFGLGTKLSLFELSPGAKVKLGKNDFIIGYKLLNDKLDLSKLKTLERFELSYYRSF